MAASSDQKVRREVTRPQETIEAGGKTEDTVTQRKALTNEEWEAVNYLELEEMERQRRNYEEGVARMMPLGDGTENEPGDPFVIQEYKGRLPHNRQRGFSPFEEWYDVRGRIHYFNTRTGKYDFCVSSDEMDVVTGEVIPLEQQGQKFDHAISCELCKKLGQPQEITLPYRTRASETR